MLFAPRITSLAVIATQNHGTQLYLRWLLWIYPSYREESNWLQQSTNIGFMPCSLCKQ